LAVPSGSRPRDFREFIINGSPKGLKSDEQFLKVGQQSVLRLGRYSFEIRAK
jgi:hypothetical protein